MWRHWTLVLGDEFTLSALAAVVASTKGLLWLKGECIFNLFGTHDFVQIDLFQFLHIPRLKDGTVFLACSL